jgi:hypothetical protein
MKYITLFITIITLNYFKFIQAQTNSSTLPYIESNNGRHAFRAHFATVLVILKIDHSTIVQSGVKNPG